jgi:hypothetical protein
MATAKKGKAAPKKATNAVESTFYYWFNTDEPSVAVESGGCSSLAELLADCKANDDGGIEDGDTLYVYEIKKRVYKINKTMTYEEVK